LNIDLQNSETENKSLNIALELKCVSENIEQGMLMETSQAKLELQNAVNKNKELILTLQTHKKEN